MSKHVNKVILIATVGRDPEVRYNANGEAGCNIPVVTTESWKDKNTGEWVNQNEWHRAVAYGPTAVYIGEHIKKGDTVYIEGSLRTRKWQDKAGVDQYTVEVKIGLRGQITKLHSPLRGEDGEKPEAGSSAVPAAPATPAAKTPTESASRAGTPQGFDDLDDDIPF